MPMATLQGSPSCHLFRLPRELRNQIYSEALHEPDGIFYWRCDDGQALFTRKSNELFSANQLKHVCRQLRLETQKLELDVNELVFRSHTLRNGKYIVTTPALQLLEFFGMCSEVTRRRLKRIHLDHYALNFRTMDEEVYAVQYIKDLHAIDEFCIRHPEITIYWHLCTLVSPHEHPLTFLKDGVMCAYALRPNALITKWLTELELDTLWCQASLYHTIWRAFDRQPSCHCKNGKECGMHIKASNFRVVPVFQDNWNWEQEFRKSFSDVNPEVAEARIALAREWFTNGI